MCTCNVLDGLFCSRLTTLRYINSYKTLISPKLLVGWLTGLEAGSCLCQMQTLQECGTILSKVVIFPH